MTYSEIIAKVADISGLSKKMVDRIYKSYWMAIRNHITSIPLKEDLSEHEFTHLKPNINIPSIGKFYITFDKYNSMKERYRIIQKYKNDKNASH